jgi:hypothetical protein
MNRYRRLSSRRPADWKVGGTAGSWEAWFVSDCSRIAASVKLEERFAPAALSWESSPPEARYCASSFPPGRRGIEVATPHLVAHAPERISTVILATGEAPEREWLAGLRRQMPKTRLEVFLAASFGYAAELNWSDRMLEQRVAEELSELLARRLGGEAG